MKLIFCCTLTKKWWKKSIVKVSNIVKFVIATQDISSSAEKVGLPLILGDFLWLRACDVWWVLMQVFVVDQVVVIVVVVVMVSRSDRLECIWWYRHYGPYSGKECVLYCRLCVPVQDIDQWKWLFTFWTRLRANDYWTGAEPVFNSGAGSELQNNLHNPINHVCLCTVAQFNMFITGFKKHCKYWIKEWSVFRYLYPDRNFCSSFSVAKTSSGQLKKPRISMYVWSSSTSQ